MADELSLPEFPRAPLVSSSPQASARAPGGALRVMCVVAHPDDECFAFGGALALASDAGAETYVVCLTDGQAATNRGTAGTAEELGRMRREEFAASCTVLGVTGHEVLEYGDGELEFADFSQASGRLVERMRGFRPDVVLTFGGDGGMNTHADHTMVSSFTTAAFHWAAAPKRFPALGPVHAAKRLFYVTTDFFFPGRHAPLPAPWTVTLDIRAVQARKFEAFRAHTSQLPLMERFQSFFEAHGTVERYTLAASPEPMAAVQTTGLSAGL
ncbi:MAG: PIG-L family deacetylase [Acidobacteriota bacterium]|nr:PIG-L family deacetylase [Acidobacteriota bacterium]